MTKASDDKRPDPNVLLAQVTAEEARNARGKLKIFFGAAAGVGKTYAMLGAGRAKAAEGVDVVVGYAEPHNRTETEAMLLGLEILPSRIVEYRETKLKEFDLDAALKRKPEILLVDELAHTNAPGSRHDKRWQDVEEVLRAGIDVYSTLNVQHIESLNDVVAQITGVIVRETLPDTVFEQANEVELVDISPEDLLERLREGKVYVPQQAQQALLSFFRKANLSALRELSLRKTAERVNEEVQSQRLGQSPRQTWPTAERVLVCISPSKSSAKVIRSAKRLAVSLRAEWVAAFVETPSLRRLDDRDREQLMKNTKLAERLGAETVTLSGLNVVEEVVSYARTRNITKIVAGKPDRPWWIDFLFHSQVDQLLRKSGEIDVYVVRGIGGDERESTSPTPAAEKKAVAWRPYGWSLLTVAICTAIAALMLWAKQDFDLSNLIMVYLVGVVVVSARYGRGPSAFAAVLSVLVFDFFFVPPRFTFAVSDSQYLITFMVMLGVALLIGTLTVRIRDQAEASRERERRTESLYRMTQQLAGTRGLAGLSDAAVRQLADVFHCHVILLTPERGADTKHLHVRSSLDAQEMLSESERAVAQWVFEHRQEAGDGTETLPSAAALYLPLVASSGAIGAVGLASANIGDLLSPAQRPLLDAFLDQIALAIERDELADQARQAQVQAEAEELRSSLLSSVSHDLRTPLAIITGASSSLIEASSGNDGAREIAETIHNEATRLNRLVGNLLDITRLESGAVKLAKQWQPIEEVIGSALGHMDAQLVGRKVTTNLSADLPMVPIDGVLIEQVLMNLLENAVKYTPPGTPIEVEAVAEAGNSGVIISVLDRGPGLSPGEEIRIFDKFVRGTHAAKQRGVGLGLAICRAAVQAHGGRIWAENRPAWMGGGAAFRFTLPIVGSPPTIPPENPESPKSQAIDTEEGTPRDVR